MLQHSLWKSFGCAIALTLVFATGAAFARSATTLDLHTGQPIENLDGLSFDGQAFQIPGRPPIPRNDVKSVEFHRDSDEGQRRETDGLQTELSALATELLPQAHKLSEENPGVGGVIIVDDGAFEYLENGTSRYYYHFAGLVLKEDMKNWAQFSTGYTEGRSRVHVLFARSVAPDGTVRDLSPADIHSTSPSEEMEFFNPNRKMLSGVIPGVDVGSVVEYAYEFENYNPENPKLFFPGYYFQGTDPVAFSRVRVDIPAGVPFNYMTRNWPEGLSAEPALQEKDGVKSYTWSLRNQPPLPIEPLMPPEHDLVPMMEGSIFSSWDEVFAMQRTMQAARIQPTPAIEAAVAQITADATTPDEKLARIYAWVQTNTRYISIKSSLSSGLSGHTAGETFENRYGDCTDKAMLFSAMCKAVGITSYPIILTTNDAGRGVTEIPTLTGNHCISEVRLDDRSFYLDSTAQNFRYPYFRADDHGAIAFNAIRGDYRPIPLPPPEDNARHSHLDVAIDRDGTMKVHTKNTYTGTIEAGIRGFWRQQREDMRNQLMAQYANEISPGALLTDFTLSDLADLSEPVVMNIDFSLPQKAIAAKKLMYFTLPTIPRDYPEVSLDQRKHPIQYMTTEARTFEIDAALPKAYRVEWTPPPLEYASPYVEYSARYEAGTGVLKYRERFRRLDRIVPPQDYPAYRDALRALAAFSQKEVFLTKES